jgi:hypothetical protein
VCVSTSDVSSSALRRSVIKSRDLARLRSFGPDTLIETDRGLLPAREIRRNDRLRTSGGEYAGIAWLDRLHLDAAFLRSVPELKPVLICEGDLGFAPLRNVVLSPQQFVWDRQVGDGGDFRPAAEVTSHPRLFERRDVNVTYISIVCHAPLVIEAEGLWVSLVP